MTEHQNPTPACRGLSSFFALLNLNEFANGLFSNVYLAAANKKFASLRHKNSDLLERAAKFDCFYGGVGPCCRWHSGGRVCFCC